MLSCVLSAMKCSKGKNQVKGTPSPPVRGCVGLWQKGQSGDAAETAGRVGPVWAEVDEKVL